MKVAEGAHQQGKPPAATLACIPGHGRWKNKPGQQQGACQLVCSSTTQSGEGPCTFMLGHKLVGCCGSSQGAKPASQLPCCRPGLASAQQRLLCWHCKAAARGLPCRGCSAGRLSSLTHPCCSSRGAQRCRLISLTPRSKTLTALLVSQSVLTRMP